MQYPPHPCKIQPMKDINSILNFDPRRLVVSRRLVVRFIKNVHLDLERKAQIQCGLQSSTLYHDSKVKIFPLFQGSLSIMMFCMCHPVAVAIFMGCLISVAKTKAREAMACTELAYLQHPTVESAHQRHNVCPKSRVVFSY